MVKVIIRDDDIGYFCRPEMLETIYGYLWQVQRPICLSVIPAHSSDIVLPEKPRLNTVIEFSEPKMPRWLYRTLYRYDSWKRRILLKDKFWYSPKICDHNIPPDYAQKGKSYLVNENQTLCTYLNQQIGQKRVEICLHGYSHEYLEFGISNAATLSRKLTAGSIILREAFPDSEIKTFIAPYDFLSDIAVKTVLQLGFNLCTRSEVLKRAIYAQRLHVVPKVDMNNVFQFTEKVKVILCDHYLFNNLEAPEVCLQNALQQLRNLKTFPNSVLIIANHFWQFYYNWKELNNSLFVHWRNFLDVLLSDDNVEITTFGLL